jgi:predicted AAA+ superfamily ATPase
MGFCQWSCPVPKKLPIDSIFQKSEAVLRILNEFPELWFGMYHRHLKILNILNNISVFLLGPRQTGKSTLIRETVSQAFVVDLLVRRTFQQLAANPDLLFEWVMASENHVIVIDEIQKLPALLDVVQRILFESRGTKKFLLTGSSARKLKREGVNLLGGRAAQVQMLPLLLSEIGTEKIDEYLQWGTLPSVVTANDRRLTLESYVSLYLDQEIRAEGLSRDMEGFAKFLEVAALTNSQQINFASLSSDVRKSEKTVAQWYSILEDTLIGYLLPCFSGTVKRKAMSAPKFFFFDCGVANALLNRFSIQTSTPEAAVALENLVFTHLRGWCSYGPLGRRLYYWRSVSKNEVDFVLTRDGTPEMAIEVKSSTHPKPEHFRGLRSFAEEYPFCRKYLVCLCDAPSKTEDGIHVVPAGSFLKNGFAEFCL